MVVGASVIVIGLLTGIGTANATAFLSNQLAPSPASGTFLETNGVTSTWATVAGGSGGSSTLVTGTNGITVTQVGVNATTSLNTSTLPSILNGLGYSTSTGSGSSTVIYPGNGIQTVASGTNGVIVTNAGLGVSFPTPQQLLKGATCGTTTGVTDAGACFNDIASAASASTAIIVPAALATTTYTYTTPMNWSLSNGKLLQLQCGVGGGFYDNSGVVFYYATSTGTALNINTNGYVAGGSGITNCSFVGPAGTGNTGSSVVASTYGITLGGTGSEGEVGAFGFTMTGVHISGFGTGLYVGSNVSFMIFDKGVINKNGQDIYSPAVSGANGENMRVTNSVIADCNSATGQSISAYCLDVQLSGNVQWTLENDSFDDAQIYSNQYGGTANIWNITDIHDEDPNTGQACYDRILTQPSYVGAAATVFNIKGGDFMEDESAGCPQFVSFGGQMTLDSTTGDINNNVSTPDTVFANPLNNQTLLSWTGLSNQGFNTGNSANTGFAAVSSGAPASVDGLEVGTTTPVYYVTSSTFHCATCGGTGGVATSSPFSTGYLPVVSPSSTLTNSNIYQNEGMPSSTVYSLPILKNKCQASTNSVSVTKLNCSLGTVASGDTVIVATQTYSPQGSATTTVADSQSNSYTKATSYIWQSSDAVGNILYSPNVTGGASFSVTSTFSNATNTFTTMYALDYGGILTASPLDVTSSNTSTGAGGSFSSGAATTTQTQELLIGEADCGGSCDATAGNGMISIATSSADSGVIEATTTVAIGSYAAPFNITSGSFTVGASMAIFKTSVSSTQAYIAPNGDISIGSSTDYGTVLGVNGNITDGNLKSQPCVGTNATGTFIAGTCGSGSGSGNLFVSPTSSVVTGYVPYYTGNGSSTVAPTSSLFIASSTGYIGIGTSTPKSPLTIYANSGGSPFFSQINIVPVSASQSAAVSLTTTAGGSSSSWYFGAGTIIPANNNFRIVDLTANNQDDLDILQGSGNIGIATTSPVNKLSVAGAEDVQTLAVGTTTINGLLNVVNASGTAAFQIASTTNNNYALTVLTVNGSSSLAIASSGASVFASPSSTIFLGTGQANPGCIGLFDAANGTQDYAYASSTSLIVTTTRPSFCATHP